MVHALAWRLFMASTLALATLYVYWGIDLYHSMNAEVRYRAETLMEERRSYIHALVQTAVNGAEHHRHTVEARIRQVIRHRVDQALQVADHLWREGPGNGPDDRAAVIREALRPMRFDDGRGYFFVFELDTGRGILHAAMPNLEGTDLRLVRDGRGKTIVPEMIALINEEGGGYYSYHWRHPNRPGTDHAKVTYVDVFEPLGWGVATGDYIRDMTLDIQKEVLDQLRAMTFGGDGYIFAGTWNGFSLLGPAAGTNVWDATDPTGVKLIQELVAAARNGGGFVSYRLPDIAESGTETFKLSYVMGIPEWEWYVGAGVSVDDIRSEIADMRAAIRVEAFQALGLGACLVIVLAAVSYLISLHIAGQVGAEMGRLEAFLAGDGRARDVLKPETIRHAEMARLVDAILAMVARRDQTEGALARQTRSLEQSNADLERFAYVASHDLREPLRMVASYVGLLRRRYYGRLDSDADTFIDYATEGAQRMHAMIGDLLEYARVKRTENPLAAVSLDKALDKALHSLSARLRDGGADVTVEGPLPVVRGQETLLVSLMQNLVDNAVKYRHPDRRPRVWIGAHVDHGWCEISVRDNGLGIEPAFRERVFQIFQRLHPGGTYPGTGVGLSICHSIVESHGGRIWVESGPDNVGSVFKVALPVCMDHGPSAPAATPATPRQS
ncbi:cache domain-containing protein [Roseospira visakhapatnamensis]|uniref:histidine kinase n=1 Tax=Roseospira visakhapatnamensis TaxID=390880 RepID=A0A7W6RAX2_9PROT|nr:cache domain-containing protein [Roseospira visakhapatnamensis]MBB4265163.1 signal transduction histidine kinase [Roseospira visakhapatnamensis]